MGNFNFSLIIKAVDQATAQIRKVSAAASRMAGQQKRASAAAKAGADAARKAAEGATQATMTWHQFVKTRMGPLMKKFAAEGKSHSEAHTLAIRQIAAEWKEYKRTGVQANEAVEQSAKKVGLGLGKLNARVKALVGSARTVGKEARRLGIKMAATAGAAAYAFKRLFVDTAAEFERYQIMLQSLEGSSEKANTAMRWVFDLANTAPQTIEELMQGYVKLRAFGLDPTNGTMQAMVDANAKLGGSNEKLQGIILAVGQAWAKGRLQGEEVLQLVERGVPVWDLLAKRTGLNVQQLRKLMEAGRLGRGTIKLLIAEMGAWSKGAAAAQARTWSGMVSMLSDQWTRFASMVMANGVFDWLKSKLAEFIDKVNALARSGRLEQIAREVGENIVLGFTTFASVMRDGVLPVLRAIGSGLRWLHDLFGSWKPVIAAVAAIMSGPLLLSIAMATKAAIGFGVALVKTLTGTLLPSIAIAAKAVIGFGAALMGTPVGWVIAAVATIAGAVYTIYKNWGGIKKFFAGLWDGIKNIFKSGVGFLTKVFEYSPLGLLFKGAGKLKEILAGSSMISSNTAPTANALRPGIARSEVGGLIRVKVESDGRARVTEMETTGGVDFEAESGVGMAGAMP